MKILSSAITIENEKFIKKNFKFQNNFTRSEFYVWRCQNSR